MPFDGGSAVADPEEAEAAGAAGAAFLGTTSSHEVPGYFSRSLSTRAFVKLRTDGDGNLRPFFSSGAFVGGRNKNSRPT